MTASEDHPSPFSKKVLAVIQPIVQRERDSLGYEPLILDPFAGIGRVHQLGTNTIGVEIEPEWAECHERTVVGDSRKLAQLHMDGALRVRHRFDMVITSPAYGNRMADHHDAKERCKVCAGGGWDEYGAQCPKCEGRGYRIYKRNTYKHRLGRDLTEGNSGAMQWGEEYQELHRRVWMQIPYVARPGAAFVLNISDHIRKGEVVAVSSWHVETILSDPRWSLEGYETVDTPRNRFGANRELRAAHEWVFTFRLAA